MRKNKNAYYILRGSSWLSDTDFLFCAYYDGFISSCNYGDMGFRLALISKLDENKVI